MNPITIRGNEINEAVLREVRTLLIPPTKRIVTLTVIAVYACMAVIAVWTGLWGWIPVFTAILLFFLVGPITGGIANLVWNHRICNRMGTELSRRGLPYKISASTFWLWGILGSLIIVGPLVFLSKFCKAMNFLASDYNTYG